MIVPVVAVIGAWALVHFWHHEAPKEAPKPPAVTEELPPLHTIAAPTSDLGPVLVCRGEVAWVTPDGTYILQSTVVEICKQLQQPPTAPVPQPKPQHRRVVKRPVPTAVPAPQEPPVEYEQVPPHRTVCWPWGRVDQQTGELIGPC